MNKEYEELKAQADALVAKLSELGADPAAVAALELHVATCGAVHTLEERIDQLEKDQSTMREHLMRLARRVDCI